MSLADFDFNLDPFADGADDISPPSVHLRLVQRNGRKCWTSIDGLPLSPDKLKILLKKFKKDFACNGTILKSTSTNGDQAFIIQLQGDQRSKINKYFEDVLKSKELGWVIQIHGA